MSTTTLPTLTYFNNQGKAEIPRLIFAYAGVQFNDVRVEWPISNELRPTLPFGVLPYYVDDDIKTGQSVAIGRYLANKYNIAGKTLVEQIQADAIVDSVWDLIMPYYPIRGDAEKLEKFKSEHIPKFLNNFDKLVKAKAGKYIVGESLTWADLSLFFALQYLAHIGFPDAVPQFPELVSYAQSIGEIPSIKAHVAARPITML
eukprot:gene7851-9213_t